MSSIVFERSVTEILQEAHAFLQDVTDPLLRTRVMIVLRLLSGAKASDLSLEYGFSISAITIWAHRADREGFKALIHRQSPGRKKALSEELYQKVKQCLNSDPNDFGFKAWTGSSITQLINERFKVKLSVRQCSRVLERYKLEKQGYTDEEVSYILKVKTQGKENADLRLERKLTHRSRSLRSIANSNTAATAALNLAMSSNIDVTDHNLDLNSFDPRVNTSYDTEQREQEAIYKLAALMEQEKLNPPPQRTCKSPKTKTTQTSATAPNHSTTKADSATNASSATKATTTTQAAKALGVRKRGRPRKNPL